MFKMFHTVRLFLINHKQKLGRLSSDSPVFLHTFPLPQILPTSTTLPITPPSTVSSFDSITKSSGYFTVRIIFPLILKSLCQGKVKIPWEAQSSLLVQKFLLLPRTLATWYHKPWLVSPTPLKSWQPWSCHCCQYISRCYLQSIFSWRYHTFRSHEVKVELCRCTAS